MFSLYITARTVSIVPSAEPLSTQLLYVNITLHTIPRNKFFCNPVSSSILHTHGGESIARTFETGLLNFRKHSSFFLFTVLLVGKKCIA